MAVRGPARGLRALIAMVLVAAAVVSGAVLTAGPVAASGPSPAPDQSGIPGRADPYAAAFGLFDRLSPFILMASGGEAGGGDCGPTPEGYFACFDPQAALNPATGAGLPALQARKLTLQAVQSYMILLDDLAAGRDLGATLTTGSRLEGTLRALAALAGLAGPVPGLVGQTIAGTATTLSDSLAESRTEERLRKTALDGHRVILTLIDHLIADTATMYDIYKSGRETELVPLQTRMLTADASGDAAAAMAARGEINRLVADINGYHGDLYLYTVFLGQTREAVAQLAAAVEAEGADGPSAREMVRKVTFLHRTARSLWAALRGEAPTAVE